jgi:hypothetical protein
MQGFGHAIPRDSKSGHWHILNGGEVERIEKRLERNENVVQKSC